VDVSGERISAILKRALDEGATAIHVEPLQGGLRVRLEVGGAMVEIMTGHRLLAPAMTGRIKNMAEMDQAEHEIPQEGRLSFRSSRGVVTFEVTSIPGPFGEAMVLRRVGLPV
jgi:general secretion pathway protein E